MSGQRPRNGPVRVGVFISLSLSFVLVASALLGPDGVTRHEKLRDELEQVRVLNENLDRENRRLRAEAKALRSNPEYVESVIRDELGWVKKDEMVFIFPSAPAPAEGPSP